MAHAERDRVEQLPQHQHPQLGRGPQQYPAHHTTDGTGDKEALGAKALQEALVSGEHADLRHHSERPEIADDGAAIPLRLPVDGTEAVIGGMAPLQQSGQQQETAHRCTAQGYQQRGLGPLALAILWRRIER